MGHHGWNGNPPRTEDDARQRIVEAAAACIERTGLAKVSLSDVAAELGVTRQTVYRYFPGLNEILSAVAQTSVEEFAKRFERHLTRFKTPAEVAVEAVVFAVQKIPSDPYLAVMVEAPETQFFTAGAMSRAAFELGAQILRGVPVAWESVGIDSDKKLADLAEVLMRLGISLLQYPSDPPRSAAETRALVRRWIGPALNT